MPRLSFGNLELDEDTQVLAAPRGSVRLSRNDYHVMQALIRRRGGLVSVSSIVEQVWQYPDQEPEFSHVAVRRSIKKLRGFLGLAGLGRHAIRCERGCGYYLEDRRPGTGDVEAAA